MPYIITTTGAYAHPSKSGTIVPFTTRTAVATLDEAQSRVWHMLVDAHGAIGRQVPSDQHHAYIAATRHDSPGGTVELPDGTVIEVRHVTEADLRSMFPIDSYGAQAAHTADVIAAFNA